jgi:hypothetical protein
VVRLCAAKSDGVQTLWIDGKQVWNKNDVRYRRENGHGINKLKFDHFHGGKTSAFAPSKTQYVECVSLCFNLHVNLIINAHLCHKVHQGRFECFTLEARIVIERAFRQIAVRERPKTPSRLSLHALFLHFCATSFSSDVIYDQGAHNVVAISACFFSKFLACCLRILLCALCLTHGFLRSPAVSPLLLSIFSPFHVFPVLGHHICT